MATKNKAIQEPIVGLVHGIQQRTEGGGNNTSPMIIWTFRIDRYDVSGNSLPPVPVQMRGYSFDGFLNDGDQVELAIDASRDWDPGELVQVKQVRNLSTGATFEAKQTELGLVGCIVGSIFALAFLSLGAIVWTDDFVPLPAKLFVTLLSLIPSIVLVLSLISNKFKGRKR